MKALCHERAEDWKRKFAHLSFSVAELTGDTEWHLIADAQKASLIVTTPEKWDSISRRWRDYMGLVARVRLLLIDEIHTINRG